jgi:hypothetical protein
VGFVECHFLVQRAAERLDDVALDLVVQPVGVDHQAATCATTPRLTLMAPLSWSTLSPAMVATQTSSWLA